MANGVAITKPAAAKKTARGGVAAQKKTPYKGRVLTPECFDKEFWAEMRVALANAGVSEEEYLQTLMEVRRELRAMSRSEIEAKAEAISAELKRYREENKNEEWGG